VPKHRRRLSPDTQKLIALLVSAIEPIAQLIDAISHIRLQTRGPLPGGIGTLLAGGHIHQSSHY
jgi:hypothetical protein